VWLEQSYESKNYSARSVVVDGVSFDGQVKGDDPD